MLADGPSFADTLRAVENQTGWTADETQHFAGAAIARTARSTADPPLRLYARPRRHRQRTTPARRRTSGVPGDRRQGAAMTLIDALLDERSDLTEN